jgi:predicted kinase
MIERQIQPLLKHLAGQYPVLTLTGPRQSGKTTLAKSVFPNKPYVSLEDPDIRQFAQNDPRGFLANYPDGVNPIEDGSLEGYELTKVDVTKLTREALKAYTDLGTKERDRAKNMFVLGLIYWLYNRNLDTTIDYLKEKLKIVFLI